MLRRKEDKCFINYPNCNEKKENNKLMFSIALEMGEESTKEIKIFENSSPKYEAQLFCKENNLGDDISEILSQVIFEKMIDSKKLLGNVKQSINSKNKKESESNAMLKGRKNDIYIKNANHFHNFQLKNQKLLDKSAHKIPIHNSKEKTEILKNIYKGRVRFVDDNQEGTTSPNRLERKKKKKQLSPSQKVEDRLINSAYEVNKKIEKMRNIQNLIDNYECSFHPDIFHRIEKNNPDNIPDYMHQKNRSNINEISEIIKQSEQTEQIINKGELTDFLKEKEENYSKKENMQEKLKAYKENKGNAFFKLYFDAILKRTSQGCETKCAPNSECTFFPKINKNYKYKLKGSLSRKDLFTNSPKSSNFMAKKMSNQAKFPFSPSIGRGPLSARNILNLPIGEYLYSKRKSFFNKINDSKCKIESKENRIKNHTNSFILPSSRSILENMKNNVFLKIFKLLDSDGDGKISSLAICKDCILLFSSPFRN